jgi:hypothetical protein
VERGCRRSVTRWLADDRPSLARKPVAMRAHSGGETGERGRIRRIVRLFRIAEGELWIARCPRRANGLAGGRSPASGAQAAPPAGKPAAIRPRSREYQTTDDGKAEGLQTDRGADSLLTSAATREAPGGGRRITVDGAQAPRAKARGYDGRRRRIHSLELPPSLNELRRAGAATGRTI